MRVALGPPNRQFHKNRSCLLDVSASKHSSNIAMLETAQQIASVRLEYYSEPASLKVCRRLVNWQAASIEFRPRLYLVINHVRSARTDAMACFFRDGANLTSLI
jgi:hypothetical protein